MLTLAFGSFSLKTNSLETNHTGRPVKAWRDTCSSVQGEETKKKKQGLKPHRPARVSAGGHANPVGFLIHSQCCTKKHQNHHPEPPSIVSRDWQTAITKQYLQPCWKKNTERLAFNFFALNIKPTAHILKEAGKIRTTLQTSPRAV